VRNSEEEKEAEKMFEEIMAPHSPNVMKDLNRHKKNR
jgi:hypothetical protein